MPDFERHPLLLVHWLDKNDAQQFVRLVPDGSGREVTTVTNGGRFFVDFHWTFNRAVPDLQGRTFQWTYMLSGFVGMAFLIGSITGLVIHKKIFRNFFTFRRDAKVAQTRWLDAHNVLGVLAWPFLFMIVLSGLAFYCYLYIPSGMQMAARYPAPPRVAVAGGGGPGMIWGRVSQRRHRSRPGRATEQGNPAPTVSIAGLFAQAQEQMGTLSGFTVSNPNRDNAIVRVTGARARPDVITFTADSMTFDGVTGRIISPPGNSVEAVQRLTNIFAGIHFAFYGGTAMRLLYFLCGAAGTIMVATGAGHVHHEAPREGAFSRSGEFLCVRRSHERRLRRRLAVRLRELFLGSQAVAAVPLRPKWRLFRRLCIDPRRAARAGDAHRFRAVCVLAGLGCRRSACVRASAAQSLDRTIRGDRGALHRASRYRLSGAQLRYRLDDRGGGLEDGGRRSWRNEHRPHAGVGGVENERQARRRARWQSRWGTCSVAGRVMYLVSAFLCAYAGFAALCAITTRNVPLVWTTPPTRGVVTALRVAGYLLLALSWLPCYLNWDVPMGTSAWVMNLCSERVRARVSLCLRAEAHRAGRRRRGAAGRSRFARELRDSPIQFRTRDPQQETGDCSRVLGGM